MTTTDCTRPAAAHHEAGHAVAAVSRGGSRLTAVTLDPDRHGEGLTRSRHKPVDDAFITYAGPWAEARHAWHQDLQTGAADQDFDFGDYLFAVIIDQPDDAAVILAAEREEEKFRALLHPEDRERVTPQRVVWGQELEQKWPVIQAVAARLLEGRTVTHDAVLALVEDVDDDG